MSPEHFCDPHPSDAEKQQLLKETGMESRQLVSWFANTRQRVWKPLVSDIGRLLRKQQQQEKKRRAQRPEEQRERSQRELPQHAVDTLRAWFMSPSHFHHPYPTEVERHQLLLESGLEAKQVSDWFVNYRKRVWKPLVLKAGRELREEHESQEASPPASKRAASGRARPWPKLWTKPSPRRSQSSGHRDSSIKWSVDEDTLLRELHDKLGNKWGDIAAHIPSHNARGCRSRLEILTNNEEWAPLDRKGVRYRNGEWRARIFQGV